PPAPSLGPRPGRRSPLPRGAPRGGQPLLAPPRRPARAVRPAGQPPPAEPPRTARSLRRPRTVRRPRTGSPRPARRLVRPGAPAPLAAATLHLDAPPAGVAPAGAPVGRPR